MHVPVCMRARRRVTHAQHMHRNSKRERRDESEGERDADRACVPVSVCAHSCTCTGPLQPCNGGG